MDFLGLSLLDQLDDVFGVHNEIGKKLNEKWMNFNKCKAMRH